MKVQTIDQFLFKKAEYIVRDEKGREVILQVDYADNQFRIQDTDTIRDSIFVEELQSIAKDLLKRKHGVNFAEK